MYWCPKRKRPGIATWNFRKVSKIQKETGWRKWRLFGGGCCPTNGEANQHAAAEGPPLTLRKLCFRTHRAFFLELSRSYHPPGYSWNRERESCHRMVIKDNLRLRVKAKRNSEIRTALLATQTAASPGCLSEMQNLRPHLGLLSQDLHSTQSPRCHAGEYILKSSVLDCLWGPSQSNQWSACSKATFLFKRPHAGICVWICINTSIRIHTYIWENQTKVGFFFCFWKK